MSDTTYLENFKSQQDTQGSFAYIASVPTLTTMTAVAIPNPADSSTVDTLIKSSVNACLLLETSTLVLQRTDSMTKRQT